MTGGKSSDDDVGVWVHSGESLVFPVRHFDNFLVDEADVVHCHCVTPRWGGGGTQLYSGRGVRPGFPKCGACELLFASEKGGLN